jgi:cell division protein FtsB
MTINEQQYTIEELEKQVEAQREKVEELKYKIERAQDPDDVEFKIEIAREKLNYHLPNEIIFYNGRSE